MLIFFIFLYFGITLSIGFIAKSKIRSTGDFINTGRNLHPAINTAALFALWFGSETIFGASARFASEGLLGVIEDPFGGVLCLLIVGFLYSRRLYRLNVLTIGDLFRKQYGSKIELFSALLMVISFIGYAGAQIVALGLILQTITNISLATGMLVSTVTVVLYTFAGGMWAVSLTDFIQSILIVAGLLIIAWYVTQLAGSIQIVLESVPDGHRQFFPNNGVLSWTNWIASWMVLGFGSIASQDIFQRVNSARSENAAYYSTIGGAILYLIFSMIPLYLVIALNIISPDLLKGDLQLALPNMVLNHMPQWIQIIFFGSLFSAILSTCSGALLAPSSLLSENIIKHNFFDTLTIKKSLLITRICVVIIGIVAFAMAFSSQDIFHLVGQASIFGLVSIFVPFTAALFYNHTSKIGALSSMILGTVVWVFFNFFYEISINPLVPGLIAAIVGLYIGTKMKGFNKS